MTEASSALPPSDWSNPALMIENELESPDFSQRLSAKLGKLSDPLRTSCQREAFSAIEDKTLTHSAVSPYLLKLSLSHVDAQISTTLLSNVCEILKESFLKARARILLESPRLQAQLELSDELKLKESEALHAATTNSVTLQFSLEHYEETLRLSAEARRVGEQKLAAIEAQSPQLVVISAPRYVPSVNLRGQFMFAATALALLWWPRGRR